MQIYYKLYLYVILFNPAFVFTEIIDFWYLFAKTGFSHNGVIPVIPLFL